MGDKNSNKCRSGSKRLVVAFSSRASAEPVVTTRDYLGFYMPQTKLEA